MAQYPSQFNSYGPTAAAYDEPLLTLGESSSLAEQRQSQRAIPIPHSSRVQQFGTQTFGTYGSYGSITETMFAGHESLDPSFGMDISRSSLSHSVPSAAIMASLGFGSQPVNQPWNENELHPPKQSTLDPFDHHKAGEYALSWSSDSPSLQPMSQQASPNVEPLSAIPADLMVFSEPQFSAVVSSSFKDEIPSLETELGPPLLDFTQPLLVDEFTPHKADGFGFNSNGYAAEQQMSQFLSNHMTGEPEPLFTQSLDDRLLYESLLSPELLAIDVTHPQLPLDTSPVLEAITSKKRGKRALSWIPVNPTGKQKSMIAPARKTGGRRGPLSPMARKKAASMRGRACTNCKQRKSPCDHGFACHACIRYHGKKLLETPCRDKQEVDQLAAALLKGDPDGAGVFPQKKTLQDFFGDGPHRIDGNERPIRLSLGFGPPMRLLANLVLPADGNKEKLMHEHVVYKWPPVRGEITQRGLHRHRVFPAQLAPRHSDETTLRRLLDEHLTLLVNDYFDLFPSFDSNLHVLKPIIYEYYTSLRQAGSDAGKEVEILRQSLKLLVLVHIGGDCHLDLTDSASIDLSEKIFGHLSTAVPGDSSRFQTCPTNLGVLPTPCFIRSQLGAVMPGLAESLMIDVLHRLEEISYGRDCGMWPTAVSVISILAMMGECVDHHTTKVGFHARLDATPTLGAANAAALRRYPDDAVASFYSRSEGSKGVVDGASAELSPSDQALDRLLQFYMNCFSTCHLRLSGISTGRSRSNSTNSAGGSSSNGASRAISAAQDALVARLKDAVAVSRDYLLQKSIPVASNMSSLEDLSWCFDRKLARLFMLALQ